MVRQRMGKTTTSSSTTDTNGQFAEVSGYLQVLLTTVEQQLAKYPLCTNIASALGVRLIWVPIGTLAIVSMIFGMFNTLISNSVGFFYPAWQSFKAIESEGSKDDTQWLTYWVVYAFFSFVEIFIDIILFWFPFYHLLKVCFLLWLFLPQYRGATKMYDAVVRPLLLRYEQQIDEIAHSLLGKVQMRAADSKNGLDAYDWAVALRKGACARLFFILSQLEDKSKPQGQEVLGAVPLALAPGDTYQKIHRDVSFLNTYWLLAVESCFAERHKSCDTLELGPLEQENNPDATETGVSDAASGQTTPTAVVRNGDEEPEEPGSSTVIIDTGPSPSHSLEQLRQEVIKADTLCDQMGPVCRIFNGEEAETKYLPRYLLRSVFRAQIAMAEGLGILVRTMVGSDDPGEDNVYDLTERLRRGFACPFISLSDLKEIPEAEQVTNAYLKGVSELALHCKELHDNIFTTLQSNEAMELPPTAHASQEELVSKDKTRECRKACSQRIREWLHEITQMTDRLDDLGKLPRVLNPTFRTLCSTVKKGLYAKLDSLEGCINYLSPLFSDDSDESLSNESLLAFTRNLSNLRKLLDGLFDAELPFIISKLPFEPIGPVYEEEQKSSRQLDGSVDASQNANMSIGNVANNRSGELSLSGVDVQQFEPAPTMSTAQNRRQSVGGHVPPNDEGHNFRSGSGPIFSSASGQRLPPRQYDPGEEQEPSVGTWQQHGLFPEIPAFQFFEPHGSGMSNFVHPDQDFPGAQNFDHPASGALTPPVFGGPSTQTKNTVRQPMKYMGNRAVSAPRLRDQEFWPPPSPEKLWRQQWDEQIDPSFQNPWSVNLPNDGRSSNSQQEHTAYKKHSYLDPATNTLKTKITYRGPGGETVTERLCRPLGSQQPTHRPAINKSRLSPRKLDVQDFTQYRR